MQETARHELALDVFDESVFQAVRAAQLHYGLKEDGIAGPRLYQNLSDTGRSLGEDLIRWSNEIEEHARTAREKGHARMVIVNIPSYTLKAIDLESGKTLLETRVIVGAPGSRTPIFTTNIIDLKYNPDWTPPPSLAARGAAIQGLVPITPWEGSVFLQTIISISTCITPMNQDYLNGKRAQYRLDASGLKPGTDWRRYWRIPK